MYVCDESGSLRRYSVLSVKQQRKEGIRGSSITIAVELTFVCQSWLHELALHSFSSCETEGSLMNLIGKSTRSHWLDRRRSRPRNHSKRTWFQKTDKFGTEQRSTRPVKKIRSRLRFEHYWDQSQICTNCLVVEVLGLALEALERWLWEPFAEPSCEPCR